MNRWIQFAVVLLIGGVFTTGVEEAQIPQQPANLKVLPKTTSTTEVLKMMVGMQKDLGVQCAFCHAEDPDTKQIDYASDENPRKETARFMMRMTNDINQKYLGQLGETQYAPPITCGNCHLGQMHPPPYEPSAK